MDNSTNKPSPFFDGVVKNAFIRHSASYASRGERRKGSHFFDVVALVCQQEGKDGKLSISDSHVVLYDVKFVPRNRSMYAEKLNVDWRNNGNVSMGKDGEDVYFFNENLLKGHALLNNLYAEIAASIRVVAPTKRKILVNCTSPKKRFLIHCA
jgi:hypothetical protein